MPGESRVSPTLDEDTVGFELADDLVLFKDSIYLFLSLLMNGP